jgi:hypothetical protein
MGLVARRCFAGVRTEIAAFKVVASREGLVGGGGASMQEADRIQTVIAEDPTIQDSSRIVVMVEKKSFWKGGKEIVLLKGSVRSESDKAKAERIAQLHAAGREVQDSIVVH